MVKIIDKFNFWLGISLLIASISVGFLKGWLTEDYGITFAFFGLYYSLIHLISPNIRELNNKQEEKEK